jgi:hypothetical protein
MVEELVARAEQNQFAPYCQRHPESDAITFYFRPDADYSTRLNDHVTLYRSLESNELVGCRIKGVDGIIEDLPNYIKVNHDGIDLSILFLPFRGNADANERATLNSLAHAARDIRLDKCPV